MAHAQDLVTNAFAFVIVLGFLIFAHESGHFFFAKLFRVRVLVFSFGFGKRLFGFRRGSTDYRVSLIPLGGYVRMAGDSPEENVSGNPDEFLSKPKWQRFLILVAGPLMNLVIAVAFVAALVMVGFDRPVSTPIVGDVTPGKAGARAGLQTGDRIVSIKGEPIEDFEDVRMLVSMNAGTPLHVVYLRNGVRHETTLTPDREAGDFGQIGRANITYGGEALVGGVKPGSPAAKAGLQSGDRITAVAGKPIRTLSEFVKAVTPFDGKPLPLTVDRAGRAITTTLAFAPNEDIGRGIYSPSKFLKLPLIAALRYSVNDNWEMLKLTVSALGRLFRAEGSVKELSGPINIARISGEALRHGWMNVIGLMATISLQLGFMNLLPIPVLDGGHLMILVIEGIARRELSLRVKERIQQLGFAVLATLMIVVLYNDVISNVLRFRNG
ncbi:MAG: RIP metalloprotease RseP [Acidobacteria bacterium]|nr:RIP metalloprotease RseP [Acidobacteriota bacterium]MBV9476512.1 RIP metalloprotease RseP [Acidobacteriota bacterium]